MIELEKLKADAAFAKKTRIPNCDPDTVLALIAAVELAQDVIRFRTHPDKYGRLEAALQPFSVGDGEG